MKSTDKLVIAIDLGTTTIAAELLDPATGKRLASAGRLNPQREFGLDVVSRLDAALKSENALGEMKRAVNGALEEIALELLHSAGSNFTNLGLVAVAGNPAMEHLLLGLPVKSLAFPPYRPLFTAGRKTTTKELGWESTADAYIFPLPGGFVGGDTVAFLHGVDLTATGCQYDSPRLFLDLGTNGEIALAQGGKIYATSAAAGPAFEGGNLACGMAALAGAVSGVRIDGERVLLDTVGGGPAEGICGSGVMMAISELLREGLLDRTGCLRSPAEITSNLANRIMERDNELLFVLHRDSRRFIYLGQKDIRQVQLAKAAIRAGIEVLFERSGIAGEDLREVVLTGSFGALLEPDSLKNVGILTEKMVEITGFVRDGALNGVAKSLCRTGGIEAVEELAKVIRVIPLSGTPLFEKHFLAQMNFPFA